MKQVVVIFLLCLGSLAHGDDIDTCKRRLLETSALIHELVRIEDVQPTIEMGRRVYTWPGTGSLIYIDENGDSSLAFGECHVDISKGEVVEFTFINELLVGHDESVLVKIEKYQGEIAELVEILDSELGLSPREFGWVVEQAKPDYAVGVSGIAQLMIVQSLRDKGWLHYSDTDIGAESGIVYPNERAWSLYRTVNK